MEDALRKRDIPYRIYGGLSFYQRKEIKDVLGYLRLVINPKDEEALKRVINYPARGIGSTTIDKLVVAAKHYDRSIFEVMDKIEQLGASMNINRGTQTRIANFVTMIKSFQIMDESGDAFELAEHVAKKTGLLQELKKDGTPEGVARMENIEELLNGMRDFVEEQKQLDGTTGSLAEFLEDVALATTMDDDKGDEDRVALMTIHLAKGLEFPFVYIVGMEEDLFPSAMSMNTRSELEEERRLFYVALTRAEKQAYLTYTESRYRWGKLVDAEPSRFIEEINEVYLDYQTPMNSYRYKPLVDADIFGDIDKTKLRLKKPVSSTPPRVGTPNQNQLRKLRKIKPTTDGAPMPNLAGDLAEGTVVEHIRFGRGIVAGIEGKGQDQKAEINFQNGGLKKLLLRFAKLKIIE
tara:strand:+ start:1 stop:1221 length:1221 start_codon:yes stop_codon:yes gene_type:complete